MSKSKQTLPVGFNLDDYYSLKEVCSMFGKDARTIYNWRKDEKLKAKDWNRHVLFEKGPTDIALERYKRMGFL